MKLLTRTCSFALSALLLNTSIAIASPSGTLNPVMASEAAVLTEKGAITQQRCPTPLQVADILCSEQTADISPALLKCRQMSKLADASLLNKGIITPSTKVIKKSTKTAKKEKKKQKNTKKQSQKQTKSNTQKNTSGTPNSPIDAKIKTVPESAPFLPKSKVKALIATAKKYIGTPYVFGGTTPKGFDCSGFLQYVFKKHGMTLPRTADEQYTVGKRTKKASDLVPGDLVFFTTYESGVSHCGIYLGKNEFIHASSSKGIRIDNLDNSYWKTRYYGGKHIVK